MGLKMKGLKRLTPLSLSRAKAPIKTPGETLKVMEKTAETLTATMARLRRETGLNS